jgi:precorrin-3B C17-methyltransferase
VVGIGPGNPLDRTRRAELAIQASSIVVGYSRYIELIADLTEGKELIASGMRQEVTRCRQALQRAAEGHAVALISSGDAGVYGMAGLALELAAAEHFKVPIEIIPGVSAAFAAAARMGAPLMLDCAFISLSDLLVPWHTIQHRLQAVAAADLVTTLYNPRSRTRTQQLETATAIFRQHRSGNTPVGVATAVSTRDERITLTDLDHLLEQDIGMRSLVIIGNSTTRHLAPWLITPRGYPTR